MTTRVRWALPLAVALLAAGGVALTATPGGPGPAVRTVPAASPSTTIAALFLPRCPTSARPQQELDIAGLPPLVPRGQQLRCLANAISGGSMYDAGYDASIELVDGRMLHLYERRGGLPVKEGPSQTVRSGTRDIAGVSWTWSVLANGATMLATTTRGVYVSLDLRGDESQVDTLASVAATLQPVESLPRPPASDICAALDFVGQSVTVAAAFESTAAAVARWQEAPPATPGGPQLVSSGWRAHPPDEPVAVCYLDGDFGLGRRPPPGPGVTPSPLPHWDRVVYLVGVDRHPIGVVFGWKHSIAIRDPGR